MRQVFFGGDSAGANLVSTYAAAISNADLQQRLGLRPVLQSQHVRGLLLHSGVFDLHALYAAREHSPKIIAWSVGNVVSAISGENPPQAQTLKNMSATPWLNRAYPPCMCQPAPTTALPPAKPSRLSLLYAPTACPYRRKSIPKPTPKNCRMCSISIWISPPATRYCSNRWILCSSTANKQAACKQDIKLTGRCF